MANKIILGIETSCDETSVAVIKNEKILSNIIFSQAKFHQKTKGVVPEIASRLQEKKIIPTISQALKQARIKLSNIDEIAVTAGPGLMGSLLVGVETAKTLAWANHLSVRPVNHIYAHMISPVAGRDLQKFKFPILVLTASGGHTILALIDSWKKYRVLGETIDDACGEAFDKIASLLGLNYPGGPQLEKLATQFTKKTDIQFPSPKINSADLNFSFSGLKTAVLYFLQKHPRARKTEVALASQNAIIKVLVEKTHKAWQQFQPRTLFVAGGVSANQALKKAIEDRFSGLSPVYFPERSLMGDNAGMVALASFLNPDTQTNWKNVKANANLSL